MPTAAQIVTFDDAPGPPGSTPWVDGALLETDVAIADHDPAWADRFAQVESLVRGALDFRALVVEHVGSTAVPGLPAKPIIDIDLTVADSTDEQAYVPALTAAGFVLRVREPWWYEHRCLRHDGLPTNLHVWSPGSPEAFRHRLFRDWLRSAPEDRARYGHAKLAAAEAANAAGEHVMQYNARKQQVVREIYARAFAAAGLV
ncbi:GrpB family protein [Isoptericola sp. G70]|uniref:GrpB family protein n=1 Tax=Isoptericola sp. G70 TaxID=3376633 RepID=UPI003A7F6D95